MVTYLRDDVDRDELGNSDLDSLDSDDDEDRLSPELLVNVLRESELC